MAQISADIYLRQTVVENPSAAEIANLGRRRLTYNAANVQVQFPVDDDNVDMVLTSTFDVSGGFALVDLTAFPAPFGGTALDATGRVIRSILIKNPPGNTELSVQGESFVSDGIIQIKWLLLPPAADHDAGLLATYGPLYPISSSNKNIWLAATTAPNPISVQILLGSASP